MPSWVYYVIAAAAGLGLVCAWRARRGPWLDDHPRCRRCGYDLFGREGDQATCPECGRAIRNPTRDVRVGKRMPRPRLMLGAVMLLLGAFVLGGAQTYFAFTGGSWVDNAPYSVLRWRAKSPDPATRQPVIDEALARHQHGALTDKQVLYLLEDAVDQLDRGRRAWHPTDDALTEVAFQNRFMPPALWERMQRHAIDYAYSPPTVPGQSRAIRFEYLADYLRSGRLTDNGLLYAADKVLALQADRSSPWNPWYAAPLVAAYDRGILADDQWERFVRQGLVRLYRIELRPLVRVGDPVPYRLTFDDPRWHSYMPRGRGNRIAELTIDLRIDRVLLDGTELDVAGMSEGESGGSDSAWRLPPALPVSSEHWAGIEPGDHELEVRFSLLATIDSPGRDTPDRFLMDVGLADQVRVLPADSTPPVMPIEVGSVREPNWKQYFGVYAAYYWAEEDGWGLQLRLDRSGYGSLPCPIYADLVAVAVGGESYRIGTYTELTRAQTRGRNQQVAYPLQRIEAGFPGPMPNFDTLRVELRPSAEAALLAVDLEPYWGETIVFEGVPVEHRRP